ncbi:MAG: hypothetical protein E5Y61_27815 [Mesorhizobium sp.]|nr:MAG: hypothetical protein E5Y61_27815 [Mesorhizobium sp.]
MEAQENIRNAWAALKLVRMAIEQTCPAGVLPSCCCLRQGPVWTERQNDLGGTYRQIVMSALRDGNSRCRPAVTFWAWHQ